MIIEDTLKIGIDPGVKTGIATYLASEKKLLSCDTVNIVVAMEVVASLNSGPLDVEVHFEDARQRTWIPKSRGREVLQGVGSVKRDCSIWETFCKEHGITFKAIPPKNIKTKLDSIMFKRVTGWSGRTSEHARDAAMIVFGS